jgi:hypothetical protein
MGLAGDHTGETSSLAKLADGSFVRTHKNSSVGRFNPSGYMNALSDRNGNSTILTRTAPTG